MCTHGLRLRDRVSNEPGRTSSGGPSISAGLSKGRLPGAPPSLHVQACGFPEVMRSTTDSQTVKQFQGKKGRKEKRDKMASWQN